MLRVIKILLFFYLFQIGILYSISFICLKSNEKGAYEIRIFKEPHSSIVLFPVIGFSVLFMEGYVVEVENTYTGYKVQKGKVDCIDDINIKDCKIIEKIDCKVVYVGSTDALKFYFEK